MFIDDKKKMDYDQLIDYRLKFWFNIIVNNFKAEIIVPKKKSTRRSSRQKKAQDETIEIATKEPGSPDTELLADCKSKYEEETQDDIQYNENMGLATAFVNRIFLRVRQIKEHNSNLAAEIDMNEWYLKQYMKNIRTVINQLPEDDRELVTILVINGVQTMIEDILVIDAENILDEDAKEVEIKRTRKISL